MTAWSLAAAGPVGHTAGLSDRSWGGVQTASAQSAGATRMWRYCTPGVELDVGAAPAELGVERVDDRGRLLGARVAAGEVEHRAVVADGRRGCSGRRPGRARSRRPSAAASIGARPVWKRRGRSRGSTCCRRRCPAPSRAGSPPPGRPRRVRPARPAWAWSDLERRPPVERGHGLVGTAVGHAHDVLHRSSLAEGSPWPTEPGDRAARA